MTEIKYKDLIIPVEAGQAITLSTTGKKLTDNIEVTFPKAETIEEWDGSHTISGGVELISFTISGTSYQAESGMTWAEWIESKYNTGNLTTLLLDGVITVLVKEASSHNYGYGLAYNNIFVPVVDVIVADRAYTEKYGRHAGGA